MLDDVEQIAEVHVLGWQQGYRGLLPQPVLDELRPNQRVARWTETVDSSAWPTRGVHVAEHDGELVGFAACTRAADVDLDGSRVAEITSFYIRPTTWGRGVGRALMGAAVQTMRAGGFESATLWVLDTNSRAIAFYEQLGWRPDGATKSDSVGGMSISDARYRLALR